jgi:hypothetical protein
MLLGIGAVVAAAYALSGYGGDAEGVLFGVILLGGGWAAILLFLGAMLGSVARRYALMGKGRYTLLICAFVFGAAALFALKSLRREHAAPEGPDGGTQWVLREPLTSEMGRTT